MRPAYAGRSKGCTESWARNGGRILDSSTYLLLHVAYLLLGPHQWGRGSSLPAKSVPSFSYGEWPGLSSCSKLSVMRSSGLCDGAAVPSLSPNRWKCMNQGPKQSHLNSEKELHSPPPHPSETLRINVNETLTHRQSGKGLMGRSKTG